MPQVIYPVILSGGVSSFDDLVSIQAQGDGVIAGVICGRAIYEGRVDVAAAVALLEGEPLRSPVAPC